MSTDKVQPNARQSGQPVAGTTIHCPNCGVLAGVTVETDSGSRDLVRRMAHFIDTHHTSMNTMAVALKNEADRLLARLEPVNTQSMEALLRAAVSMRQIAIWDDEYVEREECEVACRVFDEAFAAAGLRQEDFRGGSASPRGWDSIEAGLETAPDPLGIGDVLRSEAGRRLRGESDCADDGVGAVLSALEARGWEIKRGPFPNTFRIEVWHYSFEGNTANKTWGVDIYAHVVDHVGTIDTGFLVEGVSDVSMVARRLDLEIREFLKTKGEANVISDMEGGAK